MLTVMLGDTELPVVANTISAPVGIYMFIISTDKEDTYTQIMLSHYDNITDSKVLIPQICTAQYGKDNAVCLYIPTRLKKYVTFNLSEHVPCTIQCICSAMVD
jgi:hypothetical protein